MSNARVAIVDPYSSGAILAEELRAQNAICIAVQSSPRIPDAMKSRFNAASFVEVIEHGSNLDDTLSSLKAHNPTHVIAGFESGVQLADRLSELLSLPGNGSVMSETRRDKYLQLEVVRSRGLRTPKQFRSNSVEELLDWIRDSVDWPVILKPARSVASDNVLRCSCTDEVRRAAELILASPNVLGDPNEVVLAQEFLDGTEYVVDTVSYEGRRKTTAYWQYRRSSDSASYDAMMLLPYGGQPQVALQAFAFEVLDCLAIQFGPAHCEVMWVEGGPVLIEVGARLTAGINAILSRTCGGICQLDETVATILAPDRFLTSVHDRPQLRRRAVNVFLIPRQAGRLLRLRGLEEIERLPTLHSVSIGAKPGEVLKRVAGIVTLIDEDIRTLERDIATIRRLECDGLFEVEADL